MKIKTQVLAGFAVVTGLLVITGFAGIYGSHSLQESLKYITTTAWDTADGAMEGSIGIEAEIIGIERTMRRNRAEEPVDALVAEGMETAEEALQRMEEAGLIEESTIGRINQLRSVFASNRESLLAAHSNYLNELTRLENNFFDFQLLMEAAEEVGDRQLEELESNPGRLISWNGGLEEKWVAADGGMEASIGLLKRMYYFQRLISGKNYNESITGLNDALSFLQENGVIDQPEP